MHKIAEIKNSIRDCEEFLQKLCTAGLIKHFYHVGSSAVLKDISKSKDLDFICLVESFSRFEQDLSKPEFEKLNEKLNPEIHGEYAGNLPLNSYRINASSIDVNLIIIESFTFFQAYKCATEVQQVYNLNITDKKERIKFHHLFVEHYYNNYKTESDPNYFPEESGMIPQPILIDALNDLI